MNCEKNTYLKSLRKPTNPETSLGKFTKQSRVNSLTFLFTQEPPRLLRSHTSSCVICSSRAAQVTERGVSPEGNHGSRLTRREQDTHCYPHRSMALSHKLLAKYHTDCSHSCSDSNAHTRTLYTCVLKETIMTERAFQESLK